VDLKRLDKTYGDFYVPAFRVKAGKQDLIRNLYLTVTGVEIELKEKTAGRFSFTVASAFDWETREFLAHKGEDRVDLLDLFAFGSSIEVAFGYGDPTQLKPILSGIVTEIGTSFSESGGPELKIAGYDGMYPLTSGKSTRHWENKRDSDAVREVVKDKNLKPRVIETSPVKERIDQNEESDLAFIEKLAGRNGSTFYLREGEFYFGPRQNTGREAVELVWGEGLMSFSPQANLAKQITEVEVRGRSAERGEAIVGRARKGDESGRDAKAKTGSQRLASALDKPAVMTVRAAVRTREEAEARAKAILEERGQDFVTGDGECIGLPEIVPDSNVSLKGLSRRFSRAYYIGECTHKFDSGGYRTTFKVQEASI
jgi:phage protein D